MLVRFNDPFKINGFSLGYRFSHSDRVDFVCAPVELQNIFRGVLILNIQKCISLSLSLALSTNHQACCVSNFTLIRDVSGIFLSFSNVSIMTLICPCLSSALSSECFVCLFGCACVCVCVSVRALKYVLWAHLFSK